MKPGRSPGHPRSRWLVVTTAALAVAGTVVTALPTTAPHDSAVVVCPNPPAGCSSSNHNEVLL